MPLAVRSLLSVFVVVCSCVIPTARVLCKRLPQAPREAHYIPTKGNAPETLTALPYERTLLASLARYLLPDVSRLLTFFRLQSCCKYRGGIVAWKMEKELWPTGVFSPESPTQNTAHCMDTTAPKREETIMMTTKRQPASPSAWPLVEARYSPRLCSTRCEQTGGSTHSPTCPPPSRSPIRICGSAGTLQADAKKEWSAQPVDAGRRCSAPSSSYLDRAIASSSPLRS